MRKDILKKKHERLIAKRTALVKKGLESSDAAEVRSINEQVTELDEEIAETKAELDEIEAEEARSANPGNPPATAQTHNGGIAAAAFGVNNTQRRNEPTIATQEYRQAFMAYVQDGTPIPAEFRAGDVISTTDTGAAIPLTIMNEVINTVRKRYGNLYNKVRKTSVRGGVEYPIGALSATFKWINESTVSPRQKVDALSKVSFGYHTAEIRIAQTFVAQLLTLESFEARLAEVIAIAYLQAMDYGIVKGNGNGQMLGILNDPRVTNTITMTAADMGDWIKWRKNFFAKLPLGYRSGEFIFPLSTVDAYLETMADANGNPIFRQATGLEVNDGDALNPNGRFFGRNIALVEEDILPDFDTANASDVIGIFWQPLEYAINENFGFTMRRYFDEETNEWVDKALVVVDGKVLNPTGFYKIVKGS